MTDISNTIFNAEAVAKADASVAKTDVDAAVARVEADVASLKAMVDLDHQRVDDFFAQAKTREEKVVSDLEAVKTKVEGISGATVTDAKGFFAKVRAFFGAI